MDRYVKGILTAYSRVLNLIDAIDPDSTDLSLQCLKVRINASISSYYMMLNKDAIDNFEKEKLNTLKNNTHCDDRVLQAVLQSMQSK